MGKRSAVESNSSEENQTAKVDEKKQTGKAPAKGKATTPAKAVPAKESAKTPVKETVKESAKESTKTPVKENVKESAQEESKTPTKGKTPAKKKAKTEEGAVTTDDSVDVFIGNLSFEATEKDVKEGFKKSGVEVSSVRFATEASGKSKGYGWAAIPQKQVSKALTLQGTVLLGRPLKVEEPKGRKTSPGNEPTGIVFVGNCSTEITEAVLRKHLKDCGEITAVRFIEKRGKLTGVAFVQFATVKGAVAAVAKNGKEVLGKALILDHASKDSQEKAADNTGKAGKDSQEKVADKTGKAGKDSQEKAADKTGKAGKDSKEKAPVKTAKPRTRKSAAAMEE